MCISSLLMDSSSPHSVARGLKRIISTTQYIGICIDSTDTVYISEWDNGQVSVFSSSGQFLKCFGRRGSGEGEFRFPMGLAVDNNTGDLFVCDFYLNGHIVIYNIPDIALFLCY